jgi:hypothetical protein
MKRIIRGILADLGKKRKDYTPPIPAAPTNARTTHLDKGPLPTGPEDLDNQQPSEDPAERVRQLDYQGQRQIEKGTLKG